MNIAALSVSGLLMIHDAIKDALRVDDAIADGEKRYGVREYPDFRELSLEIEAELTARSVEFDPPLW
jgi:hypothetical protein